MTAAARTGATRVLEPGACIGRKLEVVRRLGEGGMGTLWVARNLTTEAEVAIKVLRPQRADDRDLHAAERFRHEAKLGAMLAHRNITRVYDLLEDEEGSLVLVMELLRGETLEAASLARGVFSGRDALAIMVPILGALQHAHEHGVVHRDLKPSNIFLHTDPDGHETPKLLDFGIAKMRGSSVTTQAGNVLGTPSYMSPEQVRASAKIDGRSDLFSVATVLYELLTGENPFRNDAPSATLAQVLELEVDPDPRIEPRVWLELRRALSKKPYQRHESAAAFATALCDAIGEPLPASLRLAGPSRSDPKIVLDVAVAEAAASRVVTEPPGMPKRRSRRSVAVYGAALLLAIGGVSFAIAATRSAPLARAPSASASLPNASFPNASVPILEPPVSAPPSATPAPVAPEVGGSRQAVPSQVPVRRPPAIAAPPAQRSASPTSSIARTPGF